MLRWKHYKNSVFSRAQLLGITDSKPLSRPPPKMALLQPKVPFWVFPCACWNPHFCSVWWLWMGTKKSTIFQKQIVAAKCAFLCLPNTNSVSLFFEKCHFNKKSIVLHNHPKNTIFWSFLKVSFSIFHLFSSGLSNIKKTKAKNAFFFGTPFLTPWQSAQKHFFAPLHAMCVF